MNISPLSYRFTSLSIPTPHFLCPGHHSLHLLPAVDARQKEAFHLKGRVVCPGKRNTTHGAKESNDDTKGSAQATSTEKNRKNAELG